VAWAEYEAIQSDIFDHLLAILPEFGLRVFQHPSGGDMRDWCDAVNRPQPRMQEVAPDRSQAQGS
jgi:miniconductance mechanosensitive channel